jgi:hypothetical protein
MVEVALPGCVNRGDNPVDNNPEKELKSAPQKAET